MTLEYLGVIVALADFSLTLVMDCFNALIGYLKLIDSEVLIMQGLERLATVSPTGILRTYAHLLAVDPTPGTLTDIHWRYVRVFQPDTGFKTLPFSHLWRNPHIVSQIPEILVGPADGFRIVRSGTYHSHTGPR